MISKLWKNIFKSMRALITRNIYFEFDKIPLQFVNVPYKKIFNWIVSEASVTVKPSRPWGMPALIQIEPSTLCNLRCVFCPVTLGMNRQTGNMEFAIWEKLIQEIIAGPVPGWHQTPVPTFRNPRSGQRVRPVRQDK